MKERILEGGADLVNRVLVFGIRVEGDVNRFAVEILVRDEMDTRERVLLLRLVLLIDDMLDWSMMSTNLDLESTLGSSLLE